MATSNVYNRLKARYAELEAENKKLRFEVSEQDGVIEQQRTTMSELTA